MRRVKVCSRCTRLLTILQRRWRVGCVVLVVAVLVGATCFGGYEERFVWIDAAGVEHVTVVEIDPWWKFWRSWRIFRLDHRTAAGAEG